MANSLRKWDDLLQDSTRLVAEGPGVDLQFPAIQRNLPQLEQLSRQLKSRTARADRRVEATAATRLLAQQGVDAERLTRDLRTFELRTTFEDVFPVDALSVDEYLQQVHEMTVLAAIQDAQKESLAAFNNYMVKQVEADWQQQKRDFLLSLSHTPALPAPTPPPSSLTLALTSSGLAYAGTTATQFGTPYLANGSAGGPGRGGATLARGLAPGSGTGVVATGGSSVGERSGAVYAGVLKELNRARERGMAVKVASAFKEGYEAVAGDESGSRSVTMLRIWRLLQFMLEGAQDSSRPTTPAAAAAAAGGGDGRPKPPSRALGMVVGARRFLEAGYKKYMMDVIQSHPGVARLGGSTLSLNRVRAFLRVRLRERVRDGAVLDFDMSDAVRLPPVDTTWEQIYYCLRSGLYADAKQVAQAGWVSASFAPPLAEWVDGGGSVSQSTAEKLEEECERMARIGDRQGKPGYDKKRMLLHAIVSGSWRAGERLLRDTPVLFSTIEDFMWFRLAMVHREQRNSTPEEGEGGGLSSLRLPSGGGGGTGPVSASLDELQAYLRQYPATYYTKNGREPLVYPLVLLLSCQFRQAVTYLVNEPTLASNPSTAHLRIDAIHLAIALADQGGFTVGPESRLDGEEEVLAHVAALIRQYADKFAQQQPEVALEYYVCAAMAAGGGSAAAQDIASSPAYQRYLRFLRSCLTEMLRSPAGVTLLLGAPHAGVPEGYGGVSRGQLIRFFKLEPERRDLVRGAAQQCADSAQFDEAVELFYRAGDFCHAMRIVNCQLSDALTALAGGSQNAEGRAVALQSRGEHVREMASTYNQGATTAGLTPRDLKQYQEEEEAFLSLTHILGFFRALMGNRPGDALKEAQGVAFLPLEDPRKASARTPKECALELTRAVAGDAKVSWRLVCDRLQDVVKLLPQCLDKLRDPDGSLHAVRTKLVEFVALLPSGWSPDVYESVGSMYTGWR